MTTNNEGKLKILLRKHPQGTVCLASWLEQIGISYDLQQYYRKSGWLESIGTGAFKRSGESLSWQGGLYALQNQGRLSIHAGALTALSLQGYAQYVRLSKETIFLFSPLKDNLPAWFKKYNWGQKIHHSKTSFLPEKVALTDFQLPNFTIRISSAERAILECLHLASDKLDLVECYQILENLTTLRPKLLQQLLEKCTSIKVKRLFLYMSDKAGHAWHKRLDTSKIKLGAGDRSIVQGGVYISKFGITIPEKLAKL